MIVVMRRDAKPEDIDHMIKQVESFGMKPTVLQGTERTVIAAIGDERNVPVGALESGPGVDEVLPVLAPYKIASIETKSEPTVVRDGPPRRSFQTTHKPIRLPRPQRRRPQAARDGASRNRPRSRH